MEVHDTVQEAVMKTTPKKMKWKKAKWLSEEALHIAEKRREAKGKGEKERYISIELFKKKIFHQLLPLPLHHQGTFK